MRGVADDQMLVFAMITLINHVYEDLYVTILELDHVCHVLGAWASERLNCVARRGWVDLVSENIWA